MAKKRLTLDEMREVEELLGEYVAWVTKAMEFFVEHPMANDEAKDIPPNQRVLLQFLAQSIDNMAKHGRRFGETLEAAKRECPTRMLDADAKAQVQDMFRAVKKDLN